MDLIIVVLPAPAPPLMTANPPSSANWIAASWESSNLMPDLFCRALTGAGVGALSTKLRMSDSPLKSRTAAIMPEARKGTRDFSAKSAEQVSEIISGAASIALLTAEKRSNQLQTVFDTVSWRT